MVGEITFLYHYGVEKCQITYTVIQKNAFQKNIEVMNWCDDSNSQHIICWFPNRPLSPNRLWHQWSKSSHFTDTKVIALYKKGVEYDTNNYRPISLKIRKIYCAGYWSHFMSIIKYYIVTNLVFVKHIQLYLFLIEITHYIKRNVMRVLIDFKKAFDTVDHEILLYKLECYGIRGLANDFFR